MSEIPTLYHCYLCGLNVKTFCGRAGCLAPVIPGTSVARETAAELAAQITDIVGERGKSYGPPEINFANIAAFWRAWLKARHLVDVPIDASDVGHMSALIKTARLAQTPTHRDSALDGAVYTMLGHGCAMAAENPETPS